MHTNLELEPHHRANLRKLATYLWDLQPDEKHRFFMGDFAYISTNDDSTKIAPREMRDVLRTDCSTAACAVGHAAAIFPVEESEDWWDFSKRTFGVTNRASSCMSKDAFEFMFGYMWKYVDNSPRGAAQRIIFTLSEGVPEIHQITGREELKQWEDRYARLTLADLPEEE